jgi:hypothetical protein
VEEVDGHELDRAKPAINPANQLIDDCSEILVFLDVFSARYCNLDEYDFADPFRVLRKEYFECVKLLGNSFNVIKSVDSNNQLYTLKFAL